MQHHLVDLNRQGATHVAYADETHYNVGRFRGLAVITLEASNSQRVSLELNKLLDASEISEFKWSKLRSARERLAALFILDYMLEEASKNTLRIDVITWDIEDSRHNIHGRSDTRNLRRMYYFLFGDVLGKRWPRQAVWQVFPDESSAEPWSHLLYLSEVSDWNTRDLTFQVNIVDVIPSISHREPLIQAADLFAGLAVYSRLSYETYERWKLVSDAGVEVNRKSAELSKSDWERCQVLEHLDRQCKRNKMGVSLRQKQGLLTFNPNKPLNFWWYEPQTKGDIAPRW